MTIPTNPLLTADDLLTLPDDDRQYELVRGILQVIPPPGARHGRIQARLVARLEWHVAANELGTMLTEAGFVLARDPDTVRAPDVAFVSVARIPAAGLPVGYLDGPPDLAVEVESPRNTRAEIAEKVAEYLATGARLVWVVDPERRHVVEHAPRERPRVLDVDDTLDGGDVVPGFQCTVRDIMA